MGKPRVLISGFAPHDHDAHCYSSMLAISFPHCLDYFASKWHLDSGSRFRQCLHWCIPSASLQLAVNLSLASSDCSAFPSSLISPVYVSFQFFLLPLSIQSFRLQDLQLSFFFHVFLVLLIQWIELALGIIGDHWALPWSHYFFLILEAVCSFVAEALNFPLIQS